ncbi:MAG: DUF1592 domain-containing protein [Pseudomonadota bacterium]
MVLRRLNRTEYNNTVRDLLQTSLRPADNFPDDQVGAEGFDTIGDVLDIAPAHTEQYEAAAIQLIDELFALPATSPVRSRILPCTLQAGSEAVCARDVIAAFAPRAYRRPVTPSEIDEIMALVSKVVAAGNSYQDALKAGLTSILLSPYFVFHVELDPNPTAGEVHSVTDYELATRLSYFLWSSMPDDALSRTASSSGLAQDRAEILRQVARMLEDPKASALTDNFAAEWLNMRRLNTLAPNIKVFPSYDSELRTAAARETSLFFQALVTENLPLETAVLADFTFANSRLGTHYGLPGTLDAGFSRVSLAGQRRIGLLTQASFLMTTSHPDRTSPVKRGVWVLERLLCDPPPAPPPNLDIPALVEQMPGQTLRQALEAHRVSPQCSPCHAFFDPIGLGLENYDALGTYRTTDNGVAVDAKGILSGIPFEGASQLASAIARDRRFASCMTQQLLTYAVGRSFASKEGKAYAEAMASHAIAEGNAKWRSLVEAVVTAEAFHTRRGVAP